MEQNENPSTPSERALVRALVRLRGPSIQVHAILARPSKSRSCPWCGGLTAPNAVACMHCGRDLATGSGQKSPRLEPSQNQSSKGGGYTKPIARRCRGDHRIGAAVWTVAADVDLADFR